MRHLTLDREMTNYKLLQFEEKGLSTVTRACWLLELLGKRKADFVYYIQRKGESGAYCLRHGDDIHLLERRMAWTLIKKGIGTLTPVGGKGSGKLGL